MRPKHAFVPTVNDQLEERIALSAGPKFAPGGAAILTSHAYNKALSRVRDAYIHFATKGQNYAQLRSDLAKAINPIPYHNRDGLRDTIKGDVDTMKGDIDAKTPGSVKVALKASMANLKSFVTDEVAGGTIVVR